MILPKSSDKVSFFFQYLICFQSPIDTVCPISLWNWDVLHRELIARVNSMNVIEINAICRVQIILACIRGMSPAIGL